MNCKMGLSGLVVMCLAAMTSAAMVTYDLDHVVVTGAPGVATTGTLDVTFSGAAGVDVGGYDLDIMALSPLTITGFTVVAPFDSVDVENFTDFGAGEYGASVGLLSPYPVMGASQVIGRFSFLVPADTFGTFDVDWVADFTSGQEGLGTLYTLVLNNGSITVEVPEPAGLSLLSLLGLPLLLRRR